MYNSQNLPLSKKKIIKKSFNIILVVFIVSLIMFFVLLALLESFHVKSSMLISLLVFFLFNLILTGSQIFYQYLYYKYYYYNFEDNKAEIKKGVVSNATGHVRYDKIQNIYVDQDIWDRVFGLYDVHYETAGEKSGFYSHVDGLIKENADKLVKFLNEKTIHGGYSNPDKMDENISSKVSSENEITNDPRIFTRENIPIEKRIIALKVLTKTLFFTLLSFFMSLDVYGDEESASIFIIIPIVFIISLIGTYIHARIWYKNFYFKFDSRSGVITEKVIATRNTYLYFDRVQNIDVTQGIISRFFGIFLLKIETASEGNKTDSMVINGLKKESAETLKNFILERSQRYKGL